MADEAVSAITTMGKQSFLQNLGSMTSGIVNSLMLQVPQIGATALTGLVQNKLLSKYQQSPASREPDPPAPVAAAPVAAAPAAAYPQLVAMQAPGGNLKKYAPYVLGGGAVLGAVYYMTKRRKRR